MVYWVVNDGLSEAIHQRIVINEPSIHHQFTVINHHNYSNDWSSINWKHISHFIHHQLMMKHHYLLLVLEDLPSVGWYSSVKLTCWLMTNHCEPAEKNTRLSHGIITVSSCEQNYAAVSWSETTWLHTAIESRASWWQRGIQQPTKLIPLLYWLFADFHQGYVLFKKELRSHQASCVFISWMIKTLSVACLWNHHCWRLSHTHIVD